MTTELTDALKAVLDLQHQWTAVKTPAMDTRGELIRSRLPNILRSLADERQYEVYGSSGAGNNSRVPWVRIFHPDFSPSPQEGWYVVFLFAADGSAVYISLIQGTTDWAKGRGANRDPALLAARSEQARSLLRQSDLDVDDLLENIRLQDPDLGKGYERGTAFAIGYPANAVPPDEKAIADVSRMLDLLEYVYSKQPEARTEQAVVPNELIGDEVGGQDEIEEQSIGAGVRHTKSKVWAYAPGRKAQYWNAIKYNRPNGTVVVDCSLSAAEESAPARVRVSVRDTGAGLSPELLSQLFQSFNRLGRESTAEEGTGIGLVMSKRLVELMGGSIGVESTVGVGSVFWFDLNASTGPSLKEERVDFAEIAQSQVKQGAPLRTLLYVEDNPANLKLVEQLIARRPDLRLLSARDGNLGIELARAHQPDVILMDINLPGINGIEALKILRDDPATTHIPVVALSANAMPRDIEKGLLAGFFRYLTKPIKVSEFMNTLDVALEFAGQTVVKTE